MTKQLEHVKILVVGDIMLDKYVVGNVERISPEAPVPIVHVNEEYHTLGGCGNVVRNIRELGAQVDCLASIGSDADGQLVEDALSEIDCKHMLVRGSEETIVKERIITDERKVQMIRIDRETVKRVDPSLAIEAFKAGARLNYDIIIISDYAKGMITKGLMDFLKINQSAKIIVDPKPINGFLYSDTFMITPNEKEWAVMELTSQYSLKNVQYVLETKGRDGMILHDRNTNQKWPPLESEAVDVYNVSGAGDTVVAVMGICVSLGYPIVQSAIIANKCAAYVVTQSGTTTVPKQVFQNALEMFAPGD